MACKPVSSYNGFHPRWRDVWIVMYVRENSFSWMAEGDPRFEWVNTAFGGRKEAEAFCRERPSPTRIFHLTEGGD